MSIETLNAATKIISDKFKALIQNSSVKLTLRAAWSIIQDAIAQTVWAIETNIGNAISGPEKKAKALEVIAGIIDVVFVTVNIPYIPGWVESLLEKYIRKFLLDIADGSIDAIVKTFHDTGVFAPKEAK